MGTLLFIFAAIFAAIFMDPFSLFIIAALLIIIISLVNVQPRTRTALYIIVALGVIIYVLSWRHLI